MSARFRFLAAAAIAVAAFGTTAVIAQPKKTDPNPLIPRQALFGNPVKAGAQISPDGKTLSWLAPVDGVLNIWVAPVGNMASARAITSEKTRPIQRYYWAPDAKSVLYIQDKGGDENFLLYSVDPKTGTERSLTPFDKTRVQIIGASTLQKDRILVGLNNRDARFHDVHSLDLATGKLTEVMRNEDGYAGFLADDNLVVRMALKANAQGGRDFYQVTDGKVAATPFASTGLEDSLTTSPAGYTTDGKTLYWVDSRGRNTAALVAQDVATGATSIVAEDARADVGGTLRNTRTGVVEAYSVNYLRNEWTATDPGIKASLDFLKKNLVGDFYIASRTEADDLWIVSNDPVTAPGSSYLYDRKAGKLTKLYTARPDLEGAPLPPMHPRVIKARDGLDLVSYLSLPFGTDTDANGVPTSPVPMVLMVHGGPWARDSYGSDRYHQWLTNRGYAVLSVNFRGSTGLGKSFTEAGNLQWGRKMHDDLIDAVDWAIGQKITSADKVAIMGGSYGGYATLAGLTFTPTKFACGVDIVGPSNLETLLKTIPPYWAPLVKQFHDRMGNPNTPEGLALLKERSPLYSADKIVRPLLIGQGANDPRVNQAESDQIVSAMKARSIPVTYVLFPDEGHGFARPVNNIAFNAVTENFLSQCLGGRAEPVGGDVAKSTAQVLEGADRIAGLTAAKK